MDHLNIPQQGNGPCVNNGDEIARAGSRGKTGDRLGHKARRRAMERESGRTGNRRHMKGELGSTRSGHIPGRLTHGAHLENTAHPNHAGNEEGQDLMEKDPRNKRPGTLLRERIADKADSMDCPEFWIGRTHPYCLPHSEGIGLWNLAMARRGDASTNIRGNTVYNLH
ncbi:hypothetical protein CC1G_13983 [Coprinopsis cinerea okayama7|uniref:Uncharacterized protein n=1 Tax=Coprinopsis cinerea (strain Okayama-7 / 130 / ATCC MYA-4618 / FGSC 9003) TaxID=240176 RepID=D6RKZ0_COPC7|nr:hypothetical protein CC1G_13983 [Coprinopsis cinerea okayama7\|eukprot:XP_002911944.1 hypothetical protein CC1G_13983 [Coprinopsis cinerea okayama7\